MWAYRPFPSALGPFGPAVRGPSSAPERHTVSYDAFDEKCLQSGHGSLGNVSRCRSPKRRSATEQQSDYAKYIAPILAIRDFGIAYAEDGAADATVLFPPDEKLRDPISELVRLGYRSVPLLIDCLDDGRTTSASFRGSTVSKPMNVPLGYVCLDVLIGISKAGPVHVAGCADDGLGACVKQEYYFRPDDYSRCWQDHCLPRPWVRLVQQNWKRLFRQKRIRFDNPYRRPSG